MSDESTRVEGTQTESSGGAGAHPLPARDHEGKEDSTVVEHQEAAVRQVRESSLDPAREEPGEPASGR